MFTVVLDVPIGSELPWEVHVDADYLVPSRSGSGVEFFKHGNDKADQHSVAYFPACRYVLESAAPLLRAAATIELLDELVWRVDHGGGPGSGPVIGKLADVKESIAKLPGNLLGHKGEFE